MLENSNWFKHKLLNLAGIIFLLSHSQTDCSANQISQSEQSKPNVKRTHSLENYKQLKEAPTDFADLPIYQGKTKFVNGYYLPNSNGISVCQMSYMAQEDAKTILDFYKNALSSNGWTVLFAAGPTISARHNDGHFCSVNTVESKAPRMKSKFTIAYRQLVNHKS